MSAFNRSALLKELGRLDDEDDTVVLAAARAAQALVDDVEGGWAAVISAEKNAKAAPAKKRGKVPTSGDIGDTIAALLARSDLSDDARADLIDFQSALGEGALDPQDEAYIRALATRIG
ncbi:MAG: hypothetical protein AAF684_11495 [Pseudomonadota bacterium]